MNLIALERGQLQLPPDVLARVEAAAECVSANAITIDADTYYALVLPGQAVNWHVVEAPKVEPAPTPAPAPAPVAPEPPPTFDQSQWPEAKRKLAEAATKEDMGLGDTIHRLLEAKTLGGAEWIGEKWPWLGNLLGNALMALLGDAKSIGEVAERIGDKGGCGCTDRRAWYNERYPYACDLTIDCMHCGHGDVIAPASWISAGHRRDGRRVGMLAHGGYAQIAAMFGQKVVTQPSGYVLRMGNGSRSYRDELGLQLRTPRAMQWQAELPWKSQPVRPTVAVDAEHVKAVDAYLGKFNPRNLPIVVVYPIAAHLPRRWPLAHFLHLAFRLKDQCCVIAIDGPGSKDVQAFPVHIWGPDWMWQAELHKRASLVVGNDSAGVHLASTVGAPTLVIMGPTRHEVVFGHVPEVHQIHSDYPCTGCHFKGSLYTMICDRGCCSLNALTVEKVQARAMELLNLPALTPLSELGTLPAVTVRGHTYTSAQEMSCIAALIERHGCRTVVEVGTAEGNTAAAVLGALPGIVEWTGFDVPPGTVLPEAAQLTEVPKVAGYLCQDQRYRAVIREPSDHSCPAADCVFVDGDHSESGVRADTEAALPAARRLVIWHDHCNGMAGVDRVLRELVAEGRQVRRVAGTRLAYLSMP